MADREGLQVILEPIPGVTDAGVLPFEGFAFQCPPMEDFAVEHTHTHSDYDTISAGQFSRSGGIQLRTVSFDTLIVDYGLFTLEDSDPRDIEDMRDRLIKLVRSGTPFLLTAAHNVPAFGYDSRRIPIVGPEVQWPATLRSLRVSEKAGEGDARYLNVAFVEYRDALVLSDAGSTRPGGRTLPTTVALFADGSARDKVGNPLGRPPAEPLTMSLLARQFYRDPSQWRVIARANGVTDWGAHDALILAPRFKQLYALRPQGATGEAQTLWQAKLKIPTKPR